VRLLRGLPESAERDEWDLRLLLPLGQALFGASGGGAPETDATFARAKDLAMRIGDPDAVRRAAYGTFITDMMAGRLDRVLTIGTELLAFAEQENDDKTRVVAGRMLGRGYALSGKLHFAEDYLDRTILLSQRAGTWGDAFAHNPGKTAPSTLSHVRWSQGFPEQALRLADGALQAVDRRSEMNTAGYVMSWAGLLRLLMRQPEMALGHARDLASAADERGSHFWLTAAAWIEGATLVQQGRSDAGLAALAPALHRYVAGGSRQHEPFARSLEAQAYLHLGQLEECEERLRQAHQCLADTSQHFYTPGVQLVSAALLRCQGGDEEAEARPWDAIRISRAQGSRSWELRAASELARLWRDLGRCAEARNILAPVYGWFTEGFDTPDLKDAKALLDNL
jgi:tetratricopeptide (TPR) repeat protein